MENAKRLYEIEKLWGLQHNSIQAEVYENIPDDAIYTVVLRDGAHEINLQDENWEDFEDLAELLRANLFGRE